VQAETSETEVSEQIKIKAVNILFPSVLGGGYSLKDRKDAGHTG